MAAEQVRRQRGETLTLATSLGIATCRVAPRWANAVEVSIPSATLENIQLAFSPRLVKVFHYDASVGTAGRYYDLTDNLADRNTSNLATLRSFATADRLYVGVVSRYAGLGVDVTTANSEAATLTAESSRGGGEWAALTITDNTTSGGATLAQDALITWTVPVNWKRDVVNGVDAYWVRFISSAALTATVTIDQVMPLLNKTLNAANETAEGHESILLRSDNSTQPPYRLRMDKSRYGGIEMISASLTSAANINWMAIVP